MASSWVQQKVVGICHIAGLPCEWFEGELMALLTTIEMSHYLEGWVSTSKSAIGNKRVKKIVMLYQLRFYRGSPSRSKSKGRRFSVCQ
jgi:hypothetical protein